MPRVAYRNFTGGEVIPALSVRYDLKKFGTMLQCCENFLPNSHGDIERRPGTEFVLDLGGPAVLLPFQFSKEPDDNFLLVFGEDTIRALYMDGTQSGEDMVNPYALSDVYSLSYVQVGDIVYLANKNYALRKISRTGSTGAYEWTIEEVALNQSIDAPATAPTVTAHRGTGNTSSEVTDNETYEINYMVSAVDENGIESLPSPVGSVTFRYMTDWVSGDYVTITWPAVEGAVEYNVYRDSAGYYGFIGTVSADEIESQTEVTGVKANGTALTKVKLSGAITKTNYTNTEDSSQNSSSTSNLIVSADSDQYAYVLPDGSMLVWVTQTTHSTTKSWYSDGLDNPQNEGWEVTTTTSTTGFWALVSGTTAGTYTSYETGDLGTDSGAPSGTIGSYTLSPIYSTSQTISFTDQNYEADTATTPKEDWNPFEDGNNPNTVTLHQQRLCLGGTISAPTTVYMSRTGDFESFRKSRPLQDDDPVEYMLATGAIDEIKWMATFGSLFVGTTGAEYAMSSSGSAITPSDVTITSNSFWGSSGTVPLLIGTSILHCQRSGSHVRDLAYSWETDSYTGNDLNLLAPHLVETYGIRQWAYQQEPASRVWCVRKDGALICLNYIREQQIYGWSRHVTNGEVESIASLCGTGTATVTSTDSTGSRDTTLTASVTLVVKGTLSTTTEAAPYTSETGWPASVTVDGVAYSVTVGLTTTSSTSTSTTTDDDGNSVTTTSTTYRHTFALNSVVSGLTLKGDSGDTWTVSFALANGGTYFTGLGDLATTVKAVNGSINLTANVASKSMTATYSITGDSAAGTDRSESISIDTPEDIVFMVVKRTIGGEAHYYLEQMHRPFRDDEAIQDAWYVDCGKSYSFDTATKTVTGLDHLEGMEVAVLADGAPETHTVTNGAITLAVASTDVTVGLGYTSAMVPLPVESEGETGSSLGRRRACGKCVLRLYRTVGGKYAATETGDLFIRSAWKNRTYYEIPFLPDTYGEAVQPFSGDLDITLPAGQDTDTSIILVQDKPLPFRLVALMMDVDFGEQG